MARVTVRYNTPASAMEIMRSEKLEQLVTSVATGIRGRAGKGYGQSVELRGDRVSAIVFTDTYSARRDNAKNNTLLKALGGLP